MKLLSIFESLTFNPHKYNSFKELTEKDLYDIAKWGLLDTYSLSGCWDDTDNLEEAIKCAIGDFKLFLSKNYPLELGDVPNNPIIYRIIRLKNINDLNKNKLGSSWFSNPKQFENSEFFDMLQYIKKNNTEEGETYLLKGQTSINNIDIPNTLWQRSTQWWENEIVIKNDRLVKLLSYTKMSDLIK